MWLAEGRDQCKWPLGAYDRMCHMTGCVTYSVIMASKEAGRQMTLIPNQSIISTEFLEERWKQWMVCYQNEVGWC